MTGSRTTRVLAVAGTALAVAGTAHAWWNLQHLRRLPGAASAHGAQPRVSVLIPARDEAGRIGHCLTAVREQLAVDDLEVLVLDDRSSDGTADVVKHHVADDSRVQLVESAGEPPAGWLGKTWACHQLAAAASGEVLVFVDADVVLHPDAVARVVSLLETGEVDAVSPYPRQQAVTWAERIVQPLLQWSWATLLPLQVAEQSANPALVAANGQLLAITRAAYDDAGGHESVAGDVLDDIAIFGQLKRVGRRPALADGTDVATCRMYDNWVSLRDGYSKSLWAATVSPGGAVAITSLLSLAYLAPPLAMLLRGSRVGALGYTAAVAGRALVAQRTGGRLWPDPLLHPASVLMFDYLVARSWMGRQRGTLTWKSRNILPSVELRAQFWRRV